VNKYSLFVICFIVILAMVMTSLYSPVVEAADITTAKLQSVKGDVFVKKGGGNREFKGFENMVLTQGDWLRTGAKSTAKIVYNNGTQTMINPNSQLTIERLTETNTSSKTSIKLHAGGVWNKVKTMLNIDSTYDVETPTTVLGARGTLYLVTIDANGNISLNVADGAVGASTNADPSAGTTSYLIGTGSSLQVDPSGQTQGAGPIDVQTFVQSVDPAVLVQVVNDIVQRSQEIATQAQQALGQITNQQNALSALRSATQASELASLAQQVVQAVQQSSQPDLIQQFQQELQYNNQNMQTLVQTITQQTQQTQNLNQQVQQQAQAAGLTQQEVEQVVNDIVNATVGGQGTNPTIDQTIDSGTGGGQPSSGTTTGGDSSGGGDSGSPSPAAPTLVVNGANVTVTAQPGAVVKLYKSADNTVAATLTADSAGSAVFQEVTAGSYYVKQTVGGVEGTASAVFQVELEIISGTMASESKTIILNFNQDVTQAVLDTTEIFAPRITMAGGSQYWVGVWDNSSQWSLSLEKATASGRQLIVCFYPPPNYDEKEYTAKICSGAISESSPTVIKEILLNKKTVFTGAVYDCNQDMLILTGVEGVKNNSTFDPAKLTYNDNETTPTTYTLQGAYAEAASKDALAPGKYYYDSIVKTLSIKLTTGDTTGIESLQGFDGSRPDLVTAADGWNINNGGMPSPGLSNVMVVQTRNDPQTIMDSYLFTVLMDVLNKSSGPLTDTDLASLSSLYAGGESIGSLEGLEYAKNLRVLDLSGNHITSITPLHELNGLAMIDLSNNRIVRIESLGSLTNLVRVQLNDNMISSLAPLAGLNKLSWLDISSNFVTDIRHLVENSDNGGLGSGECLFLSNNYLVWQGENAAFINSLLDKQIQALNYQQQKTFTNQATFSGAIYVNDTEIPFKELRIFGLAVTPGGTFNTKMLMYGDGETNFAGHLLSGYYSEASDIETIGESQYYYHADTGTLRIRLSDEDAAAIEALPGFKDNGTAPDMIIADTGWNLDAAGNPAPPLVREITFAENIAISCPDTALQTALTDKLSAFPDGVTDANLASITSLSIINSTIEDLEGLQYAVNLTDLSLSNNNISDLSQLSGLKKLKSLTLNSNSIESISPLINLTELQVLSLENNMILDLEGIQNLTNLRVLDLEDNILIEGDCNGNLAKIGALTGLVTLDLSNNGIIDISELQNLTNLQTLSLACNQITDITALVNNLGLGSGDTIRLANNYLDLDSGPDMQNIQALIDRGASVEYSPQNT